ncbi:MAG TPA: PAS domain S-box protein, partial [Burkholderiales bacterium]|nr:PAS domain S-box protein [Burkholderiales bacterium]
APATPAALTALHSPAVPEFDRNPTPMCVFDRETARCLAANGAALRLYGYTRDEFLSLSFQDTRHAADEADLIGSSHNGAIARHCGLRRHVKRSGEVFVADVVAQDVVLHGRAATLVLLLEASDRARLHVRRVEREQLFSALVENSPDIIARIDRELRHVYVNPAVASLTGMAPEQVIGNGGPKPGVPLELCVRWAAGVRRVFATGRRHEIEITVPTSDGVRYYASHMVPEFAADGTVETVLAIAREVTERKRAELALRASESRLKRTQHEFETLADALPEVIACYDAELRHAYVNAAVERVTGLTREEIIGRTSAELAFPVQGAAQWEQSLRRVFETGRRSRIDFECAADGGAQHYEAHHIPLTDGEGNVPSVLSVAYDVTERKRAEEERLATMSRQRDALLHEVHHRVKNNLQGIVGLLRQLATLHTPLSPVLDKAVSQLQAMAAVHGLHGRELRDAVVLTELVSEIVKAGERATGAKIHCATDPRSDPSVHIGERDAVAVSLVLNELMFNALKHGRRASGAVCVAVHVTTAGREARITIENDGALPPDFDFGRGAGLGTGLELVRTLLPTEGARVEVSQSAARVRAVLTLDPPVLAHPAQAAQEIHHGWDRRKRPYSDRRR